MEHQELIYMEGATSVFKSSLSLIKWRKDSYALDLQMVCRKALMGSSDKPMTRHITMKFFLSQQFHELL